MQVLVSSSPFPRLAIADYLVSELQVLDEPSYQRFLAAKSYAENELSERLSGYLGVNTFLVVFEVTTLILKFHKRQDRFYIASFTIDSGDNPPLDPVTRVPTVVELTASSESSGAVDEGRPTVTAARKRGRRSDLLKKIRKSDSLNLRNLRRSWKIAVMLSDDNRHRLRLRGVQIDYFREELMASLESEFCFECEKIEKSITACRRSELVDYPSVGEKYNLANRESCLNDKHAVLDWVTRKTELSHRRKRGMGGFFGFLQPLTRGQDSHV